MDRVENLFQGNKHPDFYKSFFELTFDQGLNHECHSVTTSDGYNLNLFRVISPDAKPDAPVIFIQHGLLCSGDSWVVNGEDSAAFYFAKRGYDVWLGNHRGTKYSRDHETLDPNKDGDFWEFSF